MEKKLLFSIVASIIMLIAFFITINFITSPFFIWCIFPIFTVLWWPISVFSFIKKSALLMSVLGSCLTIIFFISINFITSPRFAWSIFPLFLIMWWPLSVYCCQKKKFKLFAIIGSLLIIALLLTTNYITTAKIDWSLYTLFPVPLWPLAMFLKKLIQSIWFYICIGMTAIGYYVMLNILLSPGYPWSIFVIYEIILIIAGIYFLQQKKEFWFYFGALILSLIFFAVIFWFIGLKNIWVYEIAFMSVFVQFFLYLYFKRNYYLLIIFSSILVLLNLILNNLVFYPQHLWFLYTLLPFILLWIIMLFTNQAKTFTFALFSSISGVLYYLILNFLLSPGFLWFIYPSFALLWWPLSVYYSISKKHLFFAVAGSIILILLFISTNILTSPNILWCIFPIFLVSWWPLSIYYFVFKRKKLNR